MILFKICHTLTHVVSYPPEKTAPPPGARIEPGNQKDKPKPRETDPDDDPLSDLSDFENEVRLLDIPTVEAGLFGTLFGWDLHYSPKNLAIQNPPPKKNSGLTFAFFALRHY